MGYPNQSDVCEANPVKRGLFETASAPAGISKLVWRRSYSPQRALGVKLAAGARGSRPLLSTLAASAAFIFEVENLRPSAPTGVQRPAQRASSFGSASRYG